MWTKFCRTKRQTKVNIKKRKKNATLKVVLFHWGNPMKFRKPAPAVWLCAFKKDGHFCSCHACYGDTCLVAVSTKIFVAARSIQSG